jgi:hypothetical protein
MRSNVVCGTLAIFSAVRRLYPSHFQQSLFNEDFPDCLYDRHYTQELGKMKAAVKVGELYYLFAIIFVVFD